MKHLKTIIMVAAFFLFVTLFVSMQQKEADLLPVPTTQIEVEPEVVLEVEPELEDPKVPVCEVSALDYEAECDSESVYGYTCDMLSDNLLDTQWLAGASCSSGRSPCVVNNFVKIISETSFDKIELYNRVEKDFFINRVRLDYNNITDEEYRGGRDYTFVDSPWVIELSEPTTELKIRIIEIMGTHKNFVTGLAEVKVFGEVCN